MTTIIIGAVIGGVFAGAVSYFVSPRVQREIRKQERSDLALERLLEVIEGDHWPRVAAYGNRLDERSILVTGGATARTIRRKDEDLANLTIELQESVRQLRLYTPRILNISVVERFDSYMHLTLRAASFVGFMQVFSEPPAEPNLVEFHPLEDALFSLLRAANEALSCEWRDPREVAP